MPSFEDPLAGIVIPFWIFEKSVLPLFVASFVAAFWLAFKYGK